LIKPVNLIAEERFEQPPAKPPGLVEGRAVDAPSAARPTDLEDEVLDLELVERKFEIS
jgi:hypothetical protein